MNGGLTTAAFLTGAVVIVGKWTNGKGFDVPTAIGVGFYAVLLSALSNVNEKVATSLAVLVLVGSILTNWTAIGKGLGLNK